MGQFLDPSDLDPFAVIDMAKAAAMIEDVEAQALLIAPCLTDASFTNQSAVKAIVRGAVLRWNEAGSGALQSQTAFGFGQTVDTRQQRRGAFVPTEITTLQGLCPDTGGGSAYTSSLAGPDADLSPVWPFA